MASAKNHQKPPFRAEHMGSLLRPQALVDKRVAMDDKLAVDILQDDELHKIEDSAVDEIVKMQLDAGFHGVTDGE
jgi:methionine synthase II (cobalamin-independent)